MHEGEIIRWSSAYGLFRGLQVVGGGTETKKEKAMLITVKSGVRITFAFNSSHRPEDGLIFCNVNVLDGYRVSVPAARCKYGR